MGGRCVRHGGSLDGMSERSSPWCPRRNSGWSYSEFEGRAVAQCDRLRRMIDAYLGAPEKDWTYVLLARLSGRAPPARGHTGRGMEAERAAGTSPVAPHRALRRPLCRQPLWRRRGPAGGMSRPGPGPRPLLHGGLEHSHYDTFEAVTDRGTRPHVRLLRPGYRRRARSELRVQYLGTSVSRRGRRPGVHSSRRRARQGTGPRPDGRMPSRGFGRRTGRRHSTGPGTAVHSRATASFPGLERAGTERSDPWGRADARPPGPPAPVKEPVRP